MRTSDSRTSSSSDSRAPTSPRPTAARPRPRATARAARHQRDHREPPLRRAPGRRRRAAWTRAAWSRRPARRRRRRSAPSSRSRWPRPDARCAIAATESGNTGAMQSTCRKRSTPKLHTFAASPRARPAAATSPEEPRQRAPVADDLGQRGAAIVPSAVASPVIRRRNPPTSSVASPGTPRRGRTCGQDRGEEEDLGGPGEHHQAHGHELAQRRRARPRPSGRAAFPPAARPRPRGPSSPQHHAAEDERRAGTRGAPRPPRPPPAPAPAPASCPTGCRTPRGARRRRSAPP